MPDLYRLNVGPVQAAYYQKHFQRFEALGKAVPTWNHGAAFFTLAWLLLRKLWRPAAIYASVLASLLLVWWYGIHGRIPLPVEAAICLLASMLMCAIPGFLGNALYYQHVRSQTLRTLGQANSLAQARVLLTNDAPTKERLHMVAGIQGLIALGIATLLFANTDARPVRSAEPVPSGPPNIVIPSVESLRAREAQPFTPEMPLPQLPVQITSEPSTAAPPPEEIPAAQDKQPASDELSIVQFAQSIPAQAALPAPTLPAPALAATTPPAALAPVPAAPARDEKPAARTPAAVTKAAPPSPNKETAPKKAAPATKTAAPAKAEPADPNRLIPGKFYLNAGVYAQAANVKSAVKRLNAAKLPTLRQTVQSNKGELTRLRIGPFDTRKQAEQAAIKAKKLRIDASVFQQP